jgi:RNA polymerase sigma-70 factor (ECF subfamily)
MAISEASAKYSRYCYSISYSILRVAEDADECVNETYLRAWNAIPPTRPDNLAVFLGTITRRLSLNVCKKRSAEKRGFGQIGLALGELEESIPDVSSDFDSHMECEQIVDILNRFLNSLPEKKRNIFVRRYWHLRSIDEIAAEQGLSAENVKQILFRCRKKLKGQFEKEGYKK